MRTATLRLALIPRVMRRLVTTLIGLSASGAAQAAGPVYLHCDIDGDGIKHQLVVTIDETNSTVTTLVPTSGHIERMAASFSPDRVMFNGQSAKYTLSRVDLSIVREVPRYRWVDHGVCKLRETPKRAF